VRIDGKDIDSKRLYKIYISWALGKRAVLKKNKREAAPLQDETTRGDNYVSHASL
jgi:hypothetical protein